MARQTVVLAYQRLASEGYVRARTGSHLRRPDLPDAAPAPAVPPPTAASWLSRRGQHLAAVPASAASRDAGLGTLLAGGIPAPDLFPKKRWARCAARVLKSLSSDITGYPPPRVAGTAWPIAAHLAATRGLLADPANIVITAGTQQALRIAAELLLDPGDRPGWRIPATSPAGGARAPTLAGPGRERFRGDRRRSRHTACARGQARTGGAFARHALVARCRSAGALASLDWAGRANAWILEDDCDSEFRWSGHPLPPLANVDRVGRVIYCGTFNKTLAPALRLGFAVVPAPLVPAFVRVGTLMDRGIDTLNQAILAEFMRQGLLSPHVRRMRTEYARGALPYWRRSRAMRRRLCRSRRPVASTWSGGCRTASTKQPR